MRQKTKKQEMYLSEVLRLHQEKGWGEDRISRILPISHGTVSRWIRIFASENESTTVQMRKSKLPEKPTSAVESPPDVKLLQAEILRLQSQLFHERLRADAYDKMIEVAESKFNIPIRKKAGVKQ